MTSGPALGTTAPLAPPAPGVCDIWFLPIRHRPAWVPLLSSWERDRLTLLGATPSGASLVTSRAAQRLITARYLGVPRRPSTRSAPASAVTIPRTAAPASPVLPSTTRSPTPRSGS